jgi:hypothetical protein
MKVWAIYSESNVDENSVDVYTDRESMIKDWESDLAYVRRNLQDSGYGYEEIGTMENYCVEIYAQNRNIYYIWHVFETELRKY